MAKAQAQIEKDNELENSGQNTTGQDIEAGEPTAGESLQIHKQLQNFGAKLLAVGNKQYEFKFQLNGWVIGLIAVLLVALLIK